MRLFSNLADLLWKKTDSEAGAALRLAAAYQQVFLGDPSLEDQNLVLLDLADYSGFYRVTPAGTPGLEYFEGMRAVYGRIFRFMRMSSEEVRSLETAARDSARLRQSLAQGLENE